MNVICLNEQQTEVARKSLIGRSQSIEFQLAEFNRSEQKASRYRKLVEEQNSIEQIVVQLLEQKEVSL